MRGKAHDETVKGQVMSALLAGQGVCEVAAAYKLNESTVREWKSKLSEAEIAEVRAKKQDEFGNLLAGYLRELLTTLSVQATFARDSEWLKKQGAADVAVLHGVLTDKAIRILEAAERASGGGE